MRLFLAAVVLAILAAPPAVAAKVDIDAMCVEPYGPIVPDGATATQAQIDAARDEVLQFIKDSDVYQDCLVRMLDDRDLKLTDDQRNRIFDKIEKNQQEKESVGGAFNLAVKIFKQRQQSGGAAN